MKRIIVTVKRFQEAQIIDLDVPDDMKIADLRDYIFDSLDWAKGKSGKTNTFKMEAYPPGKILDDNESLASEMISEGAWLTFIPEKEIKKRKIVKKKDVNFPESPDSPVISWTPLDVQMNDLSTEIGGVGGSDDDDGAENNYSWKEIDT